MLDANSPRLAHAAQNVALLALSAFFMPLTASILVLSSALNALRTPRPEKTRARARSPHTPGFQPKTILVTGVGMTKGLALARLFYAAGHKVIGADFEPAYFPTACGHVSTAVRVFYKLAKPEGGGEGSARYTNSIVEIVRKEGVDLWVSCSGVASAIEDGEAKEMVERATACRAVQFDVPTTKRLHEKHSFVEWTKALGLPVPDTHTITSKAAALKLLADAGDGAGSAQGNKYIMKYIGTDDSVRGDMTLLPLDTPAATKSHISRLPISDARPWILQQYIAGPEYCTHALVIRGQVEAFVACPSAELLMHYSALPAESALSQSMLRFTQEYAAAGGPTFTGHLSFDFLVEQSEADAALRDPAKNVRLHPIECNPRAHTAVALFNETPEMAQAYMTLLSDAPAAKNGEKKGLPNGLAPQPIFPHAPTKQYYWLGHDMGEFVFLPLLSLFSADGPSFTEMFDGLVTFAGHLLFWHDGTFEAWDPWPAWWLYHVYWPVQFLIALVGGKKWSRVNVSTCKMFMC